jgi:hypothetical protein
MNDACAVDLYKNRAEIDGEFQESSKIPPEGGHLGLQCNTAGVFENEPAAFATLRKTQSSGNAREGKLLQKLVFALEGPQVGECRRLAER